MPDITDDLRRALLQLASMRHPAPADLLRSRGYRYEAELLDDITARTREELTPAPTMAPGQPPYTREEWSTAARFIADAAEAEESCTREELEEAARQHNERNRTK